MDCSPPGSSVHGILQARILEWVAIPFSKGSFWPRDQTCIFFVSCITGRFFIQQVTWEANLSYINPNMHTKQNILHITFHTFLYFKFLLRKDLSFSEQFKTHSKTERKGQRLSPDPTHEYLSPLSISSTTVAHLLQLINPYWYLIITQSL